MFTEAMSCRGTVQRNPTCQECLEDMYLPAGCTLHMRGKFAADPVQFYPSANPAELLIHLSTVLYHEHETSNIMLKTRLHLR